VNRSQQPNRIRLVSSSDGFVERRRNRREDDNIFVEEPLDFAPIVVKPISRAQVYWPYAVIFLLFCAFGGFLIAALGLFEGVVP
jgi:hypothetical protein